MIFSEKDEGTGSHQGQEHATSETPDSKKPAPKPFRPNRATRRKLQKMARSKNKAKFYRATSKERALNIIKSRKK